MKRYCHNRNQLPQICLFPNFCLKKRKKLCKFDTKKTLFGLFWTRIWKIYSHIWNQTPQNYVIGKLCKENQKCLNLGRKMTYLRFSGLGTEKNYFDIWNQYPPMCLIPKFVEKNPKGFWDKKRLIWVFWG